MIRNFRKYRIMKTDTTLATRREPGRQQRMAASRLLQAEPRRPGGRCPAPGARDPAATLAAHLNLLRAAGLVAGHREGRGIRVRADYRRMDALPGCPSDNCYAGTARAAPASTHQRSC
jgi:hypothetical protein